MNLKKYILSSAWEVKAGSIRIEAGSTVWITEERAAQLTKAGILGKKKAKIETTKIDINGSNRNAD